MKARSQATRAPQPSAEAGYVLVEAVAALALIGFLMALVLPAAPSGTGRARLEATAGAAASLLRDVRGQALGSGVAAAARFEAGARRLRAEGRAGPRPGVREVAIPADVDATVTAGGNCPRDGDRGVRIVFRADGTNCGAVLRLARGARVLRVRVDWIDGRIDVARGD